MKDLGAALSDVREAYWLVWAYQRRVLDIAALVASQFETHTFYWWVPQHADRPTRGDRDPTGCWAWDMLPMMQTSFLYTPPKPDKRFPAKGAWMLEVFVDAVLGEDLDEESGPQLGVAANGSPAHPTLKLVGWKCTAATDTDWYNAVWDAVEYPEVDGVVDHHEAEGLDVLSYTYDLADLKDRDAVLRAVENFKSGLRDKLKVEVP